MLDDKDEWETVPILVADGYTKTIGFLGIVALILLTCAAAYFRWLP